MAVNTELARKTVEFVRVTGEIIDRARKQAATKEAQDKACAELIPQVVEALVANDRIGPELRKQAEELLRDPIKALEVLANTARHRSVEESNHLGDGVTSQKRASYDSLTSPYCGQRTSEKKASDIAYELALFGREMN